MGKINVTISDDLETRFRKKVYEEKGMKKGFLSTGLEEAIELWLSWVDSDIKNKKK